MHSSAGCAVEVVGRLVHTLLCLPQAQAGWWFLFPSSMAPRRWGTGIRSPAGSANRANAQSSSKTLDACVEHSQPLKK